MKKAKGITLSIIIFFFFALMTAGALFFGIEAARCIKHLVEGAEIDIMELISLGFVMITGGSVGLVWAICDSDLFD